jgi:hypothetical protein
MRSDDLVCDGTHPGGLSARPVIVEVNVPAGSPTKFLQAFFEGRNFRLSTCIAEFKSAQQHGDTPHLFVLLGACCERQSSHAT